MIIDYTAYNQYGQKIEATMKYDGKDGEETAYLERTFRYREVKIIAKRVAR